MANEKDQKSGEFDRVIMPRDLDYRISSVMSLIRRKILEGAGRRTLARERGARKYVSVAADDVVRSAHEVLSSASSYFDQDLKQFKGKNVRRAS